MFEDLALEDNARLVELADRFRALGRVVRDEAVKRARPV